MIAIPLLHPDLSAAFTWGGETITLHAQRATIGSDAPHANHFYIELPDGTFHEVQASRLRHVLLRAQGCSTVEALANAFRHEQDQCPQHLREILATSGIYPAAVAGTSHAPA